MIPSDKAGLAEALFQEAGDALFLIDPESDELLDVNPMAQRLTGFTRSQLVHVSATTLFRFEAAEVKPGGSKLRRAVRESGVFHSQDGYLLRTSRKDVWIPVNITVARLHVSPKPLGLITARDAREQRDALRRAQTAESELRRVLDSVPDCVWSAQPDGQGGLTFRYLSPAISHLTGLLPHHFGHSFRVWCELIHPDERARVSDAIRLLLEVPDSPSTLEDEYRIVRPDGERRWVYARLKVEREDRKPVRVDGVFTDITGRRQAEQALRQSENRLSRIVETDANGLLLLTPDGRVGFANRAAERILGLSRTELIQRRWHELPWAPWQSEDGAESDQSSSVFGQERAIIHPDGSRVMLALNTGMVRDATGAVSGVVVSFSDITFRRQAEEALRTGQERLARILEVVTEGILLIDRQGRVTFTNSAGERLLGRESGTLVGQLWSEVVASLRLRNGEPVPEAERLDLRVLKNSERIAQGDRLIRLPDGRSTILTGTAVPIRDSRGEINGLVLSLADITEREKAREHLERQQALLRGLIDSSPDLIRFKDAAGVYLGCNAAYAAYANRTPDEVVGRTDADLFSAEEAQGIRQRDLLVLESGQPSRYEEWVTFPDGRKVMLDTLKTPLVAVDGRVLGLVGISRDITEARQLEEQLRQVQKMEAVGQLAGGVAHDFNNLLTAVLGNLSLILGRWPQDHPERELLVASEKAAWRAAELTSQLLGFSRRTALKVERVQLADLVNETIALLRHSIDPRVELETRVPPGLEVMGDPGQLHQVLMNLCLNGRDAMPEGGKLMIEARDVLVDAEFARKHVEARPGRFVRLRVADTGIGMTPEVRARIFEPFFTTKPMGKGNGLGLAVVFGIVKHHRGWVDCVSIVGEGSCFDVYLPGQDSGIVTREMLTQPHAVNWHDSPSPLPLEKPKAGPGRILLVDDEPMIRELGRATLTQAGFQVVLAEDGQDAVETFRREAGLFDVVVLDLTMPRMSGRDALRELVKIDPKVRVLLSSGYSAEQVSATETSGVLGFVNKPYRPQELVKAIRTALTTPVAK